MEMKGCVIMVPERYQGLSDAGKEGDRIYSVCSTSMLISLQ